MEKVWDEQHPKVSETMKSSQVAVFKSLGQLFVSGNLAKDKECFASYLNTEVSI